MNDLTALAAVARRQGWAVERTRGGHLRFRPSDPTMPLVITSSTPGDWRAVRNVRAMLRRAGLDMRSTA